MLSMECKLCGLPTPAQPVRENGHAFCCIGCREVYRHFGSDVLPAQTPQSAVATPAGAEAFLRIEGMHCSSCEHLIERIAVKIDGVLSAAASYATSTAKIVYDPERIDEAELPKALSIAGYRARLRSDSVAPYDERQALLRLVTGLGLAALVMMLYLAFFYPSHLGLVDPHDLEPVRWLAFVAVPGVILVLTSVLVFYVGLPIFRGAWIGLRARVLNMDNLLAIAILAAYGYSIGQLLSGSLDLYFDVAAMIVAVVTMGRYFEQGAKAQATRELNTLLQAWTPKARVIEGEEVQLRTLAELKPGDRIEIRQGEPIPVNGIIIAGQGAVDESLMTGEPFPVLRELGETVLGGSVLVEGLLVVEIGPVVESQLSNLARILWNVQSATAGARGATDRIARLFVPLVLVLAGLVTGGSLLGGVEPGQALLAGLATLIVSCPCTFGLAKPLTTAAGVSAALRKAIVVTSADTFEKAPRIDIVVIDKTGTLSTGKMAVVDVIGPPMVAAYAAAVERLAPHPIAQAIARLDSQKTASDFENHPGKGAVASVDGRRVAVGSQSLFAALGWRIPDGLAAEVATSASQARVVSYVGWDQCVTGAIITQDPSRPGWERILDRLREDYRVVVLTGAEHPGGYQDRADEVYASVPPEGKAAVIRRLRADGAVLMIGDGSNDAPALAAADLGIAFGAPSALAADAADVVILGERLDRIFDALNVIRTSRRRIRQNLGWALLYNAVAIPLAVSGLLNPLFAALAMSASSLLVVWNSSRPIG